MLIPGTCFSYSRSNCNLKTNHNLMSQNILTNFRSLKNGIAITSVYITTVQEIGQYLAERLFSHQTLVKWPLIKA